MPLILFRKNQRSLYKTHKPGDGYNNKDTLTLTSFTFWFLTAGARCRLLGGGINAGAGRLAGCHKVVVDPGSVPHVHQIGVNTLDRLPVATELDTVIAGTI